MSAERKKSNEEAKKNRNRIDGKSGFLWSPEQAEFENSRVANHLVRQVLYQKRPFILIALYVADTYYHQVNCSLYT
jgi:hypothetical protein